MRAGRLISRRFDANLTPPCLPYIGEEVSKYNLLIYTHMGGSNKNNTLEKKVDDILNIVLHIQEHALTKEEGVTKKEFQKMQNNFDKMNNRLEYMDQDIKEVKQRITNIETDVHSLKKQSHEDTDVLAKDIFDHEVRITKLETVTA
jgi:DNA repair exonuclease SbcCD ATPase subunit